MRAIGAWSGMVGIATAAGPIVGGWLVGWTWRSIFWLNIPLAVLVVWLCRRIPESSDPQASHHLDTKGVVLAFTYSLAQALQERGIRVNSVAPGPVWTPLIPATFPGEKVGKFGSQVPMGRAAHPDEIAPSYVFFASGRLSGYYSGEVLAPIGGETLPG